jgi:CRP-like cAMP-binding protein
LRQGAAQWRKSVSLIRAAPIAPGLGAGRIANPADLDLLVGLLPQLAGLNAKEQDGLLQGARVVDAPANTAVIRHGEASEDAYFILSGQAVAGLNSEEGSFRSLSVMEPGDFFGEIAALTGSRRTADVVTAEETSLMQVTAQALRGLMTNSVISQMVLSTMTERLTRVKITDLPRFAGYDQQELRELRTVNN